MLMNFGPTTWSEKKTMIDVKSIMVFLMMIYGVVFTFLSMLNLKGDDEGEQRAC